MTNQDIFILLGIVVLLFFILLAVSIFFIKQNLHNNYTRVLSSVTEHKDEQIEQLNKELQIALRKMHKFNVNDILTISHDTVKKHLKIQEIRPSYKITIDDGAPMILSEKEIENLMLKQVKVFSFKKYLEDIYESHYTKRFDIDELIKIYTQDKKPVSEIEEILSIDPDWCEYVVTE